MEGRREGRREGGGEWRKSSPTTAGPLSFRCVPHQMPIHGASGWREAGGGGAFFAVLLTERGRAGGRQRYEKRCEECNYEFPA